MHATPLQFSELTVIVPAFNEAAYIDLILHRLRLALPGAEIVVVDDGSSDATGEIAEKLASALDLRIERMESNAGKGAAVKRGLKFATRRWVVIQDADLEYDPEDLKQLFNESKETQSVAIYGSRYQTRGLARGGAWLNYIGVRFLAIVALVLYGRWLSDPHTCYKLIRRDIFEAIDIQSQGFELCAEINSKLLAAGHSIKEVPISYTPRTAAAGKKIVLRDFFLALWTYIRYRFHAASCSVNQDSIAAWSALNFAYLLSRISIGCLLTLGAAAKLSPLSAMPIATWWIVPAGVVLVWSIFEFVLGWACLTLVPHRLLNRALMFLFLMFLVVLGIKWFQGEARCDGLGRLPLPLGIMAIVDGMAMGSLVIFRRSWERSGCLWAGWLGSHLSTFRIVWPALLLGCVAWFGSLDAADHCFSGDSFVVDAAKKFAGTIEEN